MLPIGYIMARLHAAQYAALTEWMAQQAVQTLPCHQGLQMEHEARAPPGGRQGMQVKGWGIAAPDSHAMVAGLLLHFS